MLVVLAIEMPHGCVDGFREMLEDNLGSEAWSGVKMILDNDITPCGHSGGALYVVVWRNCIGCGGQCGCQWV